MNWQENAARLAAIMEGVRQIVADTLGVRLDDILDYQESDEVPATRGYVSAEAANIQPMGVCNYQFPLTFTIGFQVPDDGRPKFLQRPEWAFKLIQALTEKNAVQGLALIVPSDMAVSGGPNEPHGFLWGGLTLNGSTQILRG